MVTMKQTEETSSFMAYSRLLAYLHSLIAVGKGDGQEADDTRDLMDSFWHKFSPAELRLARQLSADLYLVHPTEAMPYPLDESYSPELASKFDELRKHMDYLGVLQLLSARTKDIGAYRALNLMGICYFHLGLPDISAMFTERAADFASGKFQGQFRLLVSMIRIGKRERAVELARGLLKQPSNIELSQRLFCVTVLLRESQLHDEKTRINIAEEATREFETILAELSTHNGKLTQLRVDCLYFMAESAFLRDRNAEAVALLDKALKECPTDEKSLVLRGLLKLSIDSKEAIRDFSEAIRKGTQAVQPYYYVAHDALVSENYEKSIALADLGLKVAIDSETMAELHEMIALALIRKSTSYQDLPVEDVRRHIRYAMELDPFNLEYINRMRDFEEVISQHRIPVLKIMQPTVKKAESRTDKYLQSATA
jgi:tetratricopeptide (TPR) repeat protein